MSSTRLTTGKIEALRPAKKPYRIAEGTRQRLWLMVFPSGKRSWQYRFKIEKKEKIYSIGEFPARTLAEAQERADWAAAELQNGRDPTQTIQVEKQAQKKTQAETFGAIRDEWVVRTHKVRNWSDAHAITVKEELDRHVAELDEIPIAKLTVRDRARVYAKVFDSSPGVFKRINERFTLIIEYAVEQGYISANPFPKSALKTEGGHHPAITDLPAVGDMLRRAPDAGSSEGVNRAHILLAFTAQRIANITKALWTQFDLDAGMWTIPRKSMKIKKGKKGVARPDHLVPLSPRLLEQLREWRAADPREQVYVCPAEGNKLTDAIAGTCVARLYQLQLGLDGIHVPHGWRTTFSTICHEAGKNSDAIETQLDHLIPGTRGVYYLAKLLEARRELMSWYETTLIAARDGAQIMKLRA